MRSKRPDEMHDMPDSSSGTYATAFTSLWSLSDMFISASEPELAASRFEGKREYRSPNRSTRNYSPLNRRESHRPSVREECMRGGLQEHDEIIKEASRLQISSLRREIEQLQKGAEDRKGKLQQVNFGKNRTVWCGKRKERQKWLAIIDAEGIKTLVVGYLLSTYEARISMLARENEMFVRKLDQMEKERQSMYWVALKKSKETAAQDIQQVTSYFSLSEVIQFCLSEDNAAQFT
ncbi:unnamed protein product [Gongylonema pulchrum]|uniref:Uncharacterized protein n=1 Tax=Gongylonema pulchrum TaxID=637853 RepID=A0A3P7NBT7_9BILA|nr:unnamed protein product [Gongylonema pulchrum]